MPLAELTAAINGLKAGYNIVKGFSDLKNEYDIKNATVELLDSIIGIQNNLLSIQSSYQSLLDSKSEIEKELVNLKQWETIRLNHVLKQISPGVFVYVVRESQNSPDNQYWLCANCFDTKNQKSIFQRKYSSGKDVFCPSCKTELKFPSESSPSKPKDNLGWMGV